MKKNTGANQTVTQQVEEQINGKSMAEVMAENERLLNKLSQMESVDPLAINFMKEEQAIRKAARVETDSIKVVEINDHKNISLWTKWGKRIGPMHRDNALKALRQFSALNVALSAKQPTQQEISAWLSSAEGKAWKAREDKKREDNLETRKKGSMEKILKQMADAYKLSMDDLTGILRRAEVKPLAASKDRQG